MRAPYDAGWIHTKDPSTPIHSRQVRLRQDNLVVDGPRSLLRLLEQGRSNAHEIPPDEILRAVHPISTHECVYRDSGSTSRGEWPLPWTRRRPLNTLSLPTIPQRSAACRPPFQLDLTRQLDEIDQAEGRLGNLIWRVLEQSPARWTRPFPHSATRIRDAHHQSTPSFEICQHRHHGTGPVA
ncbi:MAG TPA: hypothetical protein DCE55_16660, partial [Planctomycetaceae bacterium]|nr:hypothetical protein [Planctomycetaceae bacterium]